MSKSSFRYCRTPPFRQHGILVSVNTPVISGVPQGSVLGPILFFIHINYLENEIGSTILKFADDTKIFRRVESQEDRHKLQVDLNNLVKWAEKWQMLFDDKCKCFIEQANAKTNYSI